MVSDPVGDFIVQLKNASMTGKDRVTLPYSKLKHAVGEKLVSSGYVKSVSKRGKKVRKYLDVELLYRKNGKARITDVKRSSRPGRRMYHGVSDIKSVRRGTGSLILSTPKGILTGDEARKARVGGEALFKIW
jgi:small subunit ribosomal protein S8|tara:strand:+ start:3888 stop:4283 length:396 start_codon:yes stop_codon:yes gene_type:complete